MILQIFLADLIFGEGATRQRLTGAHDRVRIARDQRMPISEAPPLMQAAIGTACRHPACILVDVFGREHDTARHEHPPERILSAAPRCAVEQAAGHIGIMDPARIPILELQHAAFAAAIAERLPFGARHLVKRHILPEFFAKRLGLRRRLWAGRWGGAAEQARNTVPGGAAFFRPPVSRPRPALVSPSLAHSASLGQILSAKRPSLLSGASRATRKATGSAVSVSSTSTPAAGVPSPIITATITAESTMKQESITFAAAI